MSATLCPHCGHDLANDEVIERGDIRFDPRGDVTWCGQPIGLSPAQRILVHSLLKADGRTIQRHILAERMGYEGDEPDNLVAVQICRMRNRMDFDLPIESVRGLGLRWAA